MRIISIALLVILCVVIAGFLTVQPSFHHETTSSILRIGILPDESEEALRKRYAPFSQYLSAKTGIDVRLVLPSDYGDLVRLFRDREVDLAYFGGLTFVQANVLYDAMPLVMRDVDTRFTSWFLVKDGEAARDLADFRGKRFTFGNRLSTSGHLMPRHFMQTEMQIIPEGFFSEVHYSGTHEETAYLVRDGAVDLGVANSEIIENMIRGGRLKENDLRVLWETPPYTNYVWAVNEHLNEGIKTQLRDAFLELNADDVVQGKILENMGSERFLPAGDRDFLLLEHVADTLGLLDSKIK